MNSYSKWLRRVMTASLLAAPLALFAQSAAENLNLTVGKSVVIDYPTDVRQISTSNPDVVDANPVTTREILLHGKGVGSATMVVWNKAGQRTFYNVTVDLNLEPLRRLIKETFPKEDIHIQSSRESVSITGRITSKEAGDRVLALATPFAKSVINNLQIIAVVDKQIILRVKFAQLDRNKTTQLGVNIVSTGATGTIGGLSTQQFSPPQLANVGPTSIGNFTVSDALNIFAFRPDLNLGAFIKALQSEAVLQILAEPNLVTSNGKEASFLVGGEFPVPVVQGGSNAGAVTIQFREFGIKLLFNPVITENKTIKMSLKQEVSTIDLNNAVIFNGFTIPALATRKAETNIELVEGQSFIVAGLIDNRETESYSKIPGLGNLPILGALFRSKNQQQTRTELVMMVTPEIATPLNPGDPKPLPYFPKDFLVPILPPKPDSTSASSTDKKTHASMNPMKWGKKTN
jgi:pilus assembly protein CpaC